MLCKGPSYWTEPPLLKPFHVVKGCQNPYLLWEAKTVTPGIMKTVIWLIGCVCLSTPPDMDSAMSKPKTWMLILLSAKVCPVLEFEAI